MYQVSTRNGAQLQAKVAPVDSRSVQHRLAHAASHSALQADQLSAFDVCVFDSSLSSSLWLSSNVALPASLERLYLLSNTDIAYHNDVHYDVQGAC